jgi:hypothetical protein
MARFEHVGTVPEQPICTVSGLADPIAAPKLLPLIVKVYPPTGLHEITLEPEVTHPDPTDAVIEVALGASYVKLKVLESCPLTNNCTLATPKPAGAVHITLLEDPTYAETLSTDLIVHVAVVATPVMVNCTVISAATTPKFVPVMAMSKFPLVDLGPTDVIEVMTGALKLNAELVLLS